MFKQNRYAHRELCLGYDLPRRTGTRRLRPKRRSWQQTSCGGRLHSVAQAGARWLVIAEHVYRDDCTLEGLAGLPRRVLTPEDMRHGYSPIDERLPPARARFLETRLENELRGIWRHLVGVLGSPFREEVMESFVSAAGESGSFGLLRPSSVLEGRPSNAFRAARRGELFGLYLLDWRCSQVLSRRRLPGVTATARQFASCLRRHRTRLGVDHFDLVWAGALLRSALMPPRSLSNGLEDGALLADIGVSPRSVRGADLYFSGPIRTSVQRECYVLARRVGRKLSAIRIRGQVGQAVQLLALSKEEILTEHLSQETGAEDPTKLISDLRTALKAVGVNLPRRRNKAISLRSVPEIRRLQTAFEGDHLGDHTH
jgi:hypothetical protein